MKPILFVGAGPGDPELLTIKGKKALENADLIIYTGSLVPDELLEGLPGEKISSEGKSLEEISSLMIDAAREGRRVVRLHTGDPSIYGAIFEQMAALETAGIPYEIIPGVSSAMAAAATLKKELTAPGLSQTVIFCRRGGRTPVPEAESLSSLARHQATMVIFLSAAMIEEVVDDLLVAYPPKTPVAVVYKASQPEEKIIQGCLEDIVIKTKEAGIKKTALIIVGQVLNPPLLRRSYLYSSKSS